MVDAAENSAWCPAKGFRRLGMAAQRLAPGVQLLADADQTSTDVSLSHVVALYDTGAMSASDDADQYVLSIAVDEAARRRVLMKAVTLPTAVPPKDLDSWIEKQTKAAENELADDWGDPVAGLVRQRRDDPALAEQLMRRFKEAMECPNADT